jgi:DNA-binding PadR family transcriptional regulator
MLQKLEETGYLSCRTEVVGGKQRKYYRATAAGVRTLEHTKAKLHEFVKEVLRGDPPTPPIRSKARGKGPRA